MEIRSLSLVLALCAAAGCQQIPEGFDSPEPAARIGAAADAAGTNDTEAIPDLIMLLDSDDPASRLIAIVSLRRITGLTLGYDHAAPLEEREPAVVRWVEWYNENADALYQQGQGAASGSADPGGEGHG